MNIANQIPAMKVYPAELKVVLERARNGDASVLPQLNTAFAENPEFVQLFGDLARHAEDSLLTLSAGQDLFAQEALRRQLQEIRQQLQANSALEKLLVERLTLSWLAVHQADIELASLQQAARGATPAATHAERRLNSAHQRFLAAVRSLVTAQKLLRPALSPIQIAVGTGSAKKSQASFMRPAMGKKLVAVEN